MDIAAHMRRLAKDCVAHAATIGFRLDYSEASLVVLDKLIETLVVDDRGKPTEARLEEAWLFATGFGAYLGEVVIRTLGGSWVERPRDDDRFEMALLWDGVEARPLMKVYARLTGGDHDSTAGYVRALRALRP